MQNRQNSHGGTDEKHEIWGLSSRAVDHTMWEEQRTSIAKLVGCCYRSTINSAFFSCSRECFFPFLNNAFSSKQYNLLEDYIM